MSRLTWPMCLWNCHVHHSSSILRFGGRGGEPADPWLRRGAGGQTVCVLVCPCRQLLGRCVWDEALCDGELGVPQLLFHLGVLIGPGQFFISGGGTFCGDHAASRSICAMKKRKRDDESSLGVCTDRVVTGTCGWFSPLLGSWQESWVFIWGLPLSLWGHLHETQPYGFRVSTDLLEAPVPSMGYCHRSVIHPPENFCFWLRQLACCLVAQSCLTPWDSMDYSPPGFSVHGILQARILELVAISSSSGSSQLRDQTHVSCIAGGFNTGGNAICMNSSSPSCSASLPGPQRHFHCQEWSELCVQLLWPLRGRNTGQSLAMNM